MLDSGKRLSHAKPDQTLRELRRADRTSAPLGEDAGVRAVSFAAFATESTQGLFWGGKFLVILIWRRHRVGCISDARDRNGPGKESSFECRAATDCRVFHAAADAGGQPATFCPP